MADFFTVAICLSRAQEVMKCPSTASDPNKTCYRLRVAMQAFLRATQMGDVPLLRQAGIAPDLLPSKGPEAASPPPPYSGSRCPSSCGAVETPVVLPHNMAMSRNRAMALEEMPAFRATISTRNGADRFHRLTGGTWGGLTEAAGSDLGL